ncbi:hypothetical protein ACQ4M3_29190 [Leptolyngbya sp. AN03gr2]|uniref:hypothetical protein n=1 Tax=unclassified Leptolyngbya TaxID=2650499 RepID=UPI003D315668
MNNILRSAAFGKLLKQIILGLVWVITLGASFAAIVCVLYGHIVYTIACVGTAVSFCPITAAPAWWRILVGLICLVLLS